MSVERPGVSEVVGTVILIGVVMMGMVLVGVILFSQPLPTRVPILDTIISNRSNYIYIYHKGGDALRAGEYQILVDGVDRTSIFNNSGGLSASDLNWSIGQTLSYNSTSAILPRRVVILFNPPGGGSGSLLAVQDLIGAAQLPVFPFGGGKYGYNATAGTCGWQFRKGITIEGSKVAGALTNFPALISFPSDYDLVRHARSDGYDILFTASDGTTKLSHEIENYTSGNGALVAWVNVPSLASGSSTVLYMYYGNQTATDQQNKNGVWDSNNYKGVWHLNETSGNFADSTLNGNTGIDYVSATGKAGQILGGQEFDGTDDYVNAGSGSSLDITDAITLEAWVNPSASGWTKRAPVTISGSGSTLTDYQVRMTVTYDSDMKSDFSDLRFYDASDNSLSYWIESYTASSSAVVWVKVPSIPTSGTTIYMYYGNPSATSASNGYNTFIFFDDFTGSTINTTQWVETDPGGYITQNDQIIISNGPGSWGTTAMYSQTNFARSSIVAQAKYRSTCTVGATYKDTTMLWWKDSTAGASYTDFIYALYYYTTASPTGSYYMNEDGTSRGQLSGSWTCGTQYWARQILKTGGGATTQISTDESTWTTEYDSSYSTETPLKVGFTHYQGGYVYIDDFIVYKYASPEPGATVGGETTLGELFNPSAGWTRKAQITISGSGSTLTDYQVRMTVTYDSDMKSDFSDLRFYDTSGNSLSYWIESYTASSSAVVWVKVPSIPTSGTTIYMYYGNPSATSASNGDNTFIFFDDFTGTTINTAKWVETDSGNYITQNDQIIISNGAASWGSNEMHSQTNFARSSIVAQAKYRSTCTVGATYKDTTMLWWKDSTAGASYTDFIYALYYYTTASPTGSYYMYEDGTSRGALPGSWTCGTQYWARQILKTGGGATTQISTDESTWTTKYDSSYSTETPLKVGFTHYQGGYVYIDNFIVYKYASPEPAATVGGGTSSGISKLGAYGIGANTITASASINNQAISGATSSGWNHVVLSYDRANMRLYVNGIEKASSSYSAAISTNTNNLLMGGLIAFKGSIDEARISNTARSGDWIATEYSNQANPSSFYTVGPQESC